MATTLRVLNMLSSATWAEVRESKLPLAKADHRLNPCEACSGVCCQFQVELGLVEATRIALTLAVPPELVFLAVPHQSDPSGLGNQPAFMLDSGASSLAFRRHDVTLACPFKLDLQGFGRCGIYALRPGACRLFPYHLEESVTGAQLRFGSTEYCATRWLHDEHTAVACDDDLRQWRMDISLDVELAKEWNEADRADRSLSALFVWSKRRLASALAK